ncbi:hypothetical protein [Lactococcus termiticola]|uniref:Uncharacterized protein n=1 Tax=Lactococcus termiticola TaxID=2169526 RepID=A0A2R5HGQ8_9LACT|nr:hypothetical protein [Lactococcus termiticola]GBG97172.1 hypothetical protein NtB2_01310 [Lactococcus termiticola]
MTKLNKKNRIFLTSVAVIVLAVGGGIAYTSHEAQNVGPMKIIIA